MDLICFKRSFAMAVEINSRASSTLSHISWSLGCVKIAVVNACLANLWTTMHAWKPPKQRKALAMPYDGVRELPIGMYFS